MEMKKKIYISRIKKNEIIKKGIVKVIKKFNELAQRKIIIQFRLVDKLLF